MDTVPNKLWSVPWLKNLYLALFPDRLHQDWLGAFSASLTSMRLAKQARSCVLFCRQGISPNRISEEDSCPLKATPATTARPSCASYAASGTGRSMLNHIVEAIVGQFSSAKEARGAPKERISRSMSQPRPPPPLLSPDSSPRFACSLPPALRGARAWRRSLSATLRRRSASPAPPSPASSPTARCGCAAVRNPFAVVGACPEGESESKQRPTTIVSGPPPLLSSGLRLQCGFLLLSAGVRP